MDMISPVAAVGYSLLYLLLGGGFGGRIIDFYRGEDARHIMGAIGKAWRHSTEQVVEEESRQQGAGFRSRAGRWSSR